MEDDAGPQAPSLDRDQPQALQPKGDAQPRLRFLDRIDVNLTFGVLFEHALSSFEIGAIRQLV